VAFAGRKRATLELRAASFETTDHALRVVELRAEPGLAMAVGPATILAADVPVLRRSLALEERAPASPLPSLAPTRSNATSPATSSSAPRIPPGGAQPGVVTSVSRSRRA